MGQARKGQATKEASTQAQAVAKRGASMSQGERCRMIAAAAKFPAEQNDFDPEYEDDNWVEAEAEIARLLRKV